MAEAAVADMAMTQLAQPVEEDMEDILLVKLN